MLVRFCRLALVCLAVLFTGVMSSAAAQGTPAKDAKSAKKKKQFVDPILAKYDADRDGRLSRDERRAWRADRRAAALKKYDKDNDGKLSDVERKALVADRASAIFAALDRDKDGELSRREVGKARGIRFKRLQRGFERIDKDGNGRLSRNELESMPNRRGKGKRGKGMRDKAMRKSPHKGGDRI